MSNNALISMNGTDTAVQNSEMTPDQRQLLRNTICKGASEDELKAAIYTCNRLQLDPFARQIYFLKRSGGPMTAQISIDGMRLIAVRSGAYRGQTAPEWCGDDGVWKDVWLSKGPPSASRCGVHRKRFKEPLYAVALYSSYRQDSSPQWKKMPEVMLHKCAEALALRKAFPQELSGVYSDEEIPKQAPSGGNDLSAVIEFERSVRLAKTVGELKSISPPSGLGQSAIKACRGLWSKRKSELESATIEEQEEVAYEYEAEDAAVPADVDDDGQPL